MVVCSIAEQPLIDSFPVSFTCLIIQHALTLCVHAPAACRHGSPKLAARWLRPPYRGNASDKPLPGGARITMLRDITWRHRESSINEKTNGPIPCGHARNLALERRRLDLKEDIVISTWWKTEGPQGYDDKNAREESVRLSAVLWVEFAASCVELLFDFSPERSRVRDNLVRVTSRFLLGGGQVRSCCRE